MSIATSSARTRRSVSIFITSLVCVRCLAAVGHTPDVLPLPTEPAAGTSSHESDTAGNVITPTVTQREEMVQGLIYPGPFFSEDRAVYLTARPTAAAIADIIKQKFAGKTVDGKPAQLTLERIDDGHVRIVIDDIKGVILPAHAYWEYLYLDFSISITASAKSELEMKIEQAGQGPRPKRFCSALGEAESVGYPTYELTLDMDALYAIGGHPASIKGYQAFSTSEFAPDLASDASSLLAEVAADLRLRHARQFDLDTGCEQGTSGK